MTDKAKKRRRDLAQKLNVSRRVAANILQQGRGRRHETPNDLNLAPLLAAESEPEHAAPDRNGVGDLVTKLARRFEEAVTKDDPGSKMEDFIVEMGVVEEPKGFGAFADMKEPSTVADFIAKMNGFFEGP